MVNVSIVSLHGILFADYNVDVGSLLEWFLKRSYIKRNIY